MQIQQTFYSILEQAAKARVSDIYILPIQNGFQILTYAVSGLKNIGQLENERGEALIRHIKFSACMDISEIRRPQLGRWHYLLDEQSLYLRISSVADFLNRESVVIRLIYNIKDDILKWQPAEAFAELGELIQHKQGLILLAGQMGSGKTTTMYHAATKHLKNKMVLTIEDPVELVEPHFLQLQVNDAADMSYEQLLKLALRHHPDVIIIGEIRDAKTAKIVAQAALSGHLILSTVHAMSIVGIWYRLRSFGIAADILQQILIGLGYQKMVYQAATPYVALEISSGQEMNRLLTELKHEEESNVVS
ncbi:competence type IV pilus ATPase ComGA [Weissella bombi]|uniref:Competence protein ComGA n=1 Tax=Weissella bombi TaxID=1505725 RepID=A0A1C3ZZ57_9LACO|nr:competence type IV pilus ATPase ComGA [Weissella bombi]SCB87576.1 competence protein ComGA [Weissella bombi]